MAVRRYEDFFAWQLADQLDNEVTKCVRTSPGARADFRYAAQILDASAGPPNHIAEGFLRRNPKEFCRLLDYALGSIAETERRLRQGVRRGYFALEEIKEGLLLAKRCTMATLRLKQSQQRYILQLEEIGRKRKQRFCT